MNDPMTSIKVDKALIECETHLKRMDYARNKLKSLMPLTEATYKTLRDEQIEALDQYIFRFTKMQDAMGERLFRHILALLEEPAHDQPFLDKLNRLEQLGALESKGEWLKLRTLRNQLTHEYEDDALSMSQAINLVFDSYPVVQRLYQRAADYIRPYLS